MLDNVSSSVFTSSSSISQLKKKLDIKTIFFYKKKRKKEAKS